MVFSKENPKMKQGRRGTVIWLILLGFVVGLLGLAAVTGNTTISPVIALTLAIAYVGVALVALADFRLQNLQGIMPPLAAATKITPAARKATQRARNRADYAGSDTML